MAEIHALGSFIATQNGVVDTSGGHCSLLFVDNLRILHLLPGTFHSSFLIVLMNDKN
jgi:hypothetical protein